MSSQQQQIHNKKVHFNKEICKLSVGGTQTIQKLNSTNNLSTINNENVINNKQSNKMSLDQLTTTTANNNNNKDNLITVAIRVRPLNRKELSTGQENILHINDSNHQLMVKDRSNNEQKFNCDFCFTEKNSSQQYVYECIGAPLLMRAFDGYNISLFAYGQTGSGKTYSMIGTQTEPGIIPRFIDNVFDKVKQLNTIQQTSTQTSFQIEICYYEIYNEKIYDLLRSSSNENTTTGSNKPLKASTSQLNQHLTIRENPLTGPYIVDLLTMSVDTANDVKLWFDIGNKRRATACTNMNEKSSRSHSVFQINLSQLQQTDNKITQIITSKISLIDLAGSERIQSSGGSGSASSHNSGVIGLRTTASGTSQSRFKESTCINKSLLTLGKIICLLSERQINTNCYLPYRESALTWLLKESLGGNSKTTMLATINCSNQYLDETICTLRYAAKTACIKNTAMLNRNYKKKIFNEFGQEIEINVLNKQERDNILNELMQIQNEWKRKLDDANKRKEDEIRNLEKSLILLYENEKCSSNCCLINLNEDPSLSEKLIYLIRGFNDANENETTIGSDRQSVHIYLSGPLIAPIHAKIVKSIENDDIFIEQIDKQHVTYVNGELITDRKLLNHSDRIIFGGSHFFRFNYPSMRSNAPTNVNAANEFKDYLFAKNEIENKQNKLLQEKYESELNKFKQDGDLKIKELKSIYEQNIEKIKNDLENEKLTNKQQIEAIRCESAKKLKKIVYKNIKLETKLNLLESFNNTGSSNDNQSNSLTSASNNSSSISTNNDANNYFQTPTRHQHQRLFEKLRSELKKSENEPEIIESHISSSVKFSLMLNLNEANKICNLLKYEYEFKLNEIYDQAKRAFTQTVCVVNTKLNLATLWNLDTFEEKLNQLKEHYSRFVDENEQQNSESIFFNQDDEWQNLNELLKHNYFSPKIVENALNKSKACKRRLSLLQDTSARDAIQAALAQQGNETPYTTCKKTCNTIDQPQTDTTKLNKQSLFNYVLATCRDVLCDQTNLVELNDYYCFTNDLVYITCSRLHYYINKLNHKHNCEDVNHSIVSNSTNMSTVSEHDDDDSAYYCVQLTSLATYLAFNYQIRHTNDTATTIDDLNKQINDKIKQLIEQINVFLQSIENRLHDLIQNIKQSILNILNDLIRLKGEMTFIGNSEVYFNRLYSNTIKIDPELLKSYAIGVQNQFVIYVNWVCQYLVEQKSVYGHHLDSLIDSILKFIDNIKEIKNEKLNSNKSQSIDELVETIDYANYMLKTHKNLNNLISELFKCCVKGEPSSSSSSTSDYKINKISFDMLNNSLNLILTDSITFSKLYNHKLFKCSFSLIDLFIHTFQNINNLLKKQLIE